MTTVFKTSFQRIVSTKTTNHSFNLLFLFFLIFLAQNCSSLFKTTTPVEFNYPDKVRIKLTTITSPIHIESEGPIRVTVKNKKQNHEGSFAYFPEEYVSGDKVFLEPKKGIFKINGKEYRGNLEIYRTPKDALAINHILLEDYLLSVVPSEMPASWHIEALKAQAVAARSYAAFHINNSKSSLYDLETDTNSQMYTGIKTENPNSTRAVRETKSMVLVYNDKPINAFFHSHSGGVTESPEKVWGQKLGYLKSVKSEYCNVSKPLEWEIKFDSSTLSSKLNKFGVGEISEIKILDTTPSGRVASLSIQGENGNILVSGQDFRSLIGSTRIKSLLFDIVDNENYFHFKGKGYGHGVGMSQHGSWGMAMNNFKYEDILKYYYKDVNLVKAR
jgi:stage II sporulation protein D